MTMSPIRGRLFTWLAWTLANALGQALAFSIVLGVSGVADSEPDLALCGASVGIGAILGTFVGLAQLLALRGARFGVRAGQWIPGTAMGGTVAWLFGLLIGLAFLSNEAIGTALAGAVAGVSVGCAQ